VCIEVNLDPVPAGEVCNDALARHGVLKHIFVPQNGLLKGQSDHMFIRWLSDFASWRTRALNEIPESVMLKITLRYWRFYG
jgi:hypothetical protein